MREIEMKFKVYNPEEMYSLLKKKGCLLNASVQKDTIYVQNLNDTESKEGAIFLRVRKTDEKIELTYKRKSSKANEAREIEFGVDSYELANEFLKALGFKEWVQVNKKRTHTKYGDFNLCLDEVERLGTFLEIEILVEKDDDVDYEKRILEVAEELKIDSKAKIDSHYDTMIAELNDYERKVENKKSI